MFKLKKERINQRKIDSGASGAVFPYQKDASDLKWVVKRIHADDADEVLNSLPEIVLGFSCDHPCIVPLKGYSIQKGSEGDYYVYMKFPRMKESIKKKFDDQQRTKTPFSEQEIVQYFYSLVSAVEYLHAKKIYHRDIKPANILLDHQGNAKLSDIGVAKYVGDEEIYQQLTGQGGTVDYTAPEFYREKEKLTKESLRENDVWSIGLVMLELCALEKRLFSPLTAREKIMEIQEKLEKKLNEVYAEKLIHLIFQLLKIDPKERIKIEDVKKKLEKEYSYCKEIARDSEKKEGGQSFVEEIHALNESLRGLQEKYKNGLQGMMTEVGILKQENLKLRNDLKEYQSSIKKLQFQMISEVSKHYNETIERLNVENLSLIYKVVRKKQELEKKRRLEEKCKSRTQEMMAFVGSLKQENLKLRNDLKEYQSSVKELQLQIFSDISKCYNQTLEKLKAQSQKEKHSQEEKPITKSVEEKKEGVQPAGIIHPEQLDQEKKEQSSSFERDLSPKLMERRLVKAGVLGTPQSGKKSFVHRLTEDRFLTDLSFINEFTMKLLTRPGKRIFLGEWQIGPENYYQRMGMTQDGRTMAPGGLSYGVFFILYDITDKESLWDLEVTKQWKTNEFSGEVVFLVGTKIDLESQRQVTKEKAAAIAKELGFFHVEVSAKTGENFKEFEEELTTALCEKYWPSAVPTTEKTIEKPIKKEKSSFWGLFG